CIRRDLLRHELVEPVADNGAHDRVSRSAAIAQAITLLLAPDFHDHRLAVDLATEDGLTGTPIGTHEMALGAVTRIVEEDDAKTAARLLGADAARPVID